MNNLSEDDTDEVEFEVVVFVVLFDVDDWVILSCLVVISLFSLLSLFLLFFLSSFDN